MDNKLTLSLDEDVIKNAKLYAKKNNISLSKLIESYLAALTIKKEKAKLTPLVASLSGVIKLSGDYDEKGDYTAYLSEKYK